MVVKNISQFIFSFEMIVVAESQIFQTLLCEDQQVINKLENWELFLLEVFPVHDGINCKRVH